MKICINGVFYAPLQDFFRAFPPLGIVRRDGGPVCDFVVYELPLFPLGHQCAAYKDTILQFEGSFNPGGQVLVEWFPAASDVEVEKDERGNIVKTVEKTVDGVPHIFVGRNAIQEDRFAEYRQALDEAIRESERLYNLPLEFYNLRGLRQWYGLYH